MTEDLNVTQPEVTTQNPPQDAAAVQGAQPQPQAGQPQPQAGQPQPQNGQPQPQGGQPAQGAPATPPNPAAHKASWIANTAEMLAGGPSYKTTFNPETNEVTRERVPPSGKNIAMALVIHALQGSLAGAGAKGPNAVGESAAAGVKQGEVAAEQKQKMDQDAQKWADEQFNQHAATIQNNLRMRQMAVSMADHDMEWNQKQVDSFAPLLKRLQDAGAIIPGTEQGLTEDEITKRMQTDGQAFAKQNGIPVGTDVVRDPKTGAVVKDEDGVPKVQMKYALFDPSYKITMPDGMQDSLSYWKMPGYVNAQGDTHSALQTSPVAASAYLQAKTEVSQLDTAQREMQQYADKMGVKGVSKDVLRDAMNNNQVSKSDILSLEQIEGGHPIDQALDLLAKSNPQAAGRLTALYNKIAPLSDFTEKYKADQAVKNDEAKKNALLVTDPVATEDQALAIKASKNPSISADRRAEAQNFLDDKAAQTKAQKEDVSQGEIDELAKNIVGGDLAKISQSTSYRGGQRIQLTNALHKEAIAQGKNPADWSPEALETKAKMYEDYNSNKNGSTGQNITAFDTFLGHANDAMDANEAWRRSGSPLINRPLSWIAKNASNDQTYKDYAVALEPVRKEFMSFLNANRAEHESDIKTMETILDDNATPAQQETALKQLGKSADIRLAAIGKKWQNTFGSPYPSLVSEEGKQTMQRMGINSKSEAVQQVKPADKIAEAAKKGFVIPPGKVPAWDKQGNIAGYADDDKGTNVHRFFGAAPVQK